MPTPEEKPEFRPPLGYTVRWRTMKGPDKGFVLRDAQGEELGFFRVSEGRQSVADVFKAHLKPQLARDTRGQLKAVITFDDSEGKRIGSWELDQQVRNEIEAMIKDLANR